MACELEAALETPERPCGRHAACISACMRACVRVCVCVCVCVLEVHALDYVHMHVQSMSLDGQHTGMTWSVEISHGTYLTRKLDLGKPGSPKYLSS